MREDLEKASYENLHSLLRHYSAQLFNGRVSIITICVLLWAFILGVAKDFSDTATVVGPLKVTTKTLVAYFACYLLPMFSSIETSYFRRYLAILKCGKAFEQRFGIDSYFTSYGIIKSHPFFFFYVLNLAAFGVLVTFKLSSQNQFWVTLLATISLCIPITLLVRDYVIFIQWRRALNKLDSASGAT